jgi:uncharacterized membrane protein
VTFNELLLFIHVVFAIAWVGGSISLSLNGMRVMGAKDPDAGLHLIRQANFMGKVFNISGILVAAAGIWLVIRFDPAYGFDQFWISYALAAVIVSALLGMFFFAKQTRRAIAIGEKEGAASPAFDALGRRIGQVATFDLLLLLSVVWMMVVKPGA